MDPIRSYLKDIRSIPLLTAKQEISLAKRIKRGDARARRQMTLSNLRLVINIAKRYSHLGVPLLDLIEEGNLGLMKAITKYNPKMGFRFSTYGAWWIRQYVTRAIANQGKTVRIPVYMTELISKFKQVAETLAQKYGRKPSPREIARRMRLPVERVERLQELVASIQTTSLETRVGEEGETEMIDLLADEGTHSPQEDITRYFQRERIGQMLKKMNPREAHILILRYGLDCGVSRTLGETAKHFGITRERVRQIEVAAIKKLRVLMAQEDTGETSVEGTSSSDDFGKGNQAVAARPSKPKAGNCRKKRSGAGAQGSRVRRSRPNKARSRR